VRVGLENYRQLSRFPNAVENRLIHARLKGQPESYRALKDRGHGHTVDELRDLVKSVRSGEFEYDERPKKSLDWSSYTEAQAYELADMLYLITKLVDEAVNLIPAEELEKKGRGRPPVHSPGDVAKVLLMQSYFGVSNRVAAGLALVFKEKLRLSDTFSYKTIERGYDPGPVTRILQEVFRLTNEYGNANEDTFSFDGTGEPTSTKVNYESVRSEQRREKDSSTSTATNASSWPSRHEFQYSESSVGVHTKVFGGSTSTEGHSVGELLMFPSVLSQTRINCLGMRTALGDAEYSTRPVCSMATASGARPYFFPKVNSIYMSHGVPSWKEMMYEFVDDPQQWLRTYHMRSISEAANSMDKRRFPWKLKKRLAWRKDVESFLRRDVHNIRQYSYLSYLQPDLIKKMRF
jgi:transposase